MSQELIDGFKDIAEGVEIEFLQATLLFGSFHNSHEGYAVLKEEVDELWDDVKDNNLKGALREAKQVAAMAIRFIYDLQEKAD